MTKDEFTNRYGNQLQSILFAGYFYGEKDAGMRYRKMANDAELLISLLGKMHGELFPAQPLPIKAGNNGSPQPGVTAAVPRKG